MKTTALAYLRSGLCVLPALLTEKRPAVGEWKKFQERLPTETEVQSWFAGDDPDAACCLLTGKVSGNLELLDFDLKGELFDAWSKRVAERSSGLIERLVIETSQSGGFHAIYRCETAVNGNLKLAQRKLVCENGEEITVANKKYKPRQDAEGKLSVVLSLIETRGEGGLFLCYPSPGYELLQGNLEQLPVLTTTEREILLEAAWSLNEHFTEVAPPSNSSLFGDDRPGDHFNERGDIRELLKKHGWTLVKGGENEYWARPGKTDGWSATLKDRVLFVFSTSAAPFEPQRAYSPFTAYALLEHGGDFSAAASALRSQGYGAPAPSYVNDFRQYSGSPSSATFQMPEITPHARSVRELVGTFPDLREPIVQGLLREGEIMNLIASTKLGKSWLATDLAIAVSTGRTWLEQFECERGDVLIIDNELHPETSAHRIPKVAAARQIPFDAFADHLFVENLRGRINDVLSMEQYFKKIPVGRYKLIILDAFYRFMPRNMDENDNGTMTTIYNRLDDYAEKLRTSFVLIHHTSKGNQSAKTVTDVGAGAGSQSRATDTHLVLRLHDQPDVAVLDAAVRSWPPLDPRCLRWAYPVWTPADDLDPNQLRQEGKQRKSSPVIEAATDPNEILIESAEEFVEEFVGTEPQLRELIIEEAEAAGISNARAKQLLKRALARGLIYRWQFDGNQCGYATCSPYSETAVEYEDQETAEHSKREIVAQMLSQYPDMSSKDIAVQCGVSKRYVNLVRKEIQGGN